MSSKAARSSHRILNILTILLVALGGLAAGYWLAGSPGSVNATSSDGEAEQISVDEFDLPPLLRHGMPLPDIRVLSSGGDSLALSELCGDDLSLVTFLSSGCDPCYSWVDWIETSALFQQRVVRPILLADAPESFTERTVYPVYRVVPNQSFDLGIEVHPFILGVSRSHTIVIAENGFRTEIDENFILDQFER